MAEPKKMVQALDALEQLFTSVRGEDHSEVPDAHAARSQKKAERVLLAVRAAQSASHALEDIAHGVDTINAKLDAMPGCRWCDPLDPGPHDPDPDPDPNDPDPFRPTDFHSRPQPERRGPPVRPSEPISLALYLTLRTITKCEVGETSVRAEAKIREFMRDNKSTASDQDVADAISRIPPGQTRTTAVYADAVYEAVRRVVLEPGRNLPHRMHALEDARRILAAADQCGRPAPPPGGKGESACTCGSGCCPGAGCCAGASAAPSMYSTEVLRDVSQLTTLLIGSSSAFADAMRMQSDAIAYSLAAFNKVGDMQRQDALALAITARAAADDLNRS